MEVSSLIVPRVEVYWGPVNLTSPAQTPDFFKEFKVEPQDLGPLVFDVRVGMEDQGQTTTGSFKFNPTGLGFRVYEKLLKEYIDYSIMITFYYVTGRYIPFEFYWGGQTETYGKEMEMTVKLVTLMDGLLNANMYATAQADREEKGKSHKDSVAVVEAQYGVKDYNLIQYTAAAEKDTSKSIVKMSYNDGSNFMDAVQNLVKDNGNYVFFNNIGRANALVYTPYTWEVKTGMGGLVSPLTLANSTTPLPPNPSVRYYHFFAPGIISSFTRTSEWQPPQKSQELSSALGRKPEGKKSEAKQDQKTKASPDKKQRENRQTATAPTGVYGSKGASSNIKSENNGDGPKKQDMFTKERAAKLSATVFMCPALVGLKPLDIVFISNYTGEYMEDWIVNSVEYQQTQGGVELSVQASRPFGLGESMTPRESVPITGKVSLEQWQEYAWYLPYSTRQVPTTKGSPQGVPGAGKTLWTETNNTVTIEDENFKIYLKNNAPELGITDAKATIPANAPNIEKLEMLKNNYQVNLGDFTGIPVQAVPTQPPPTAPAPAAEVPGSPPSDPNTITPSQDTYDYLKSLYDGQSSYEFNDQTRTIRVVGEDAGIKSVAAEEIRKAETNIQNSLSTPEGRTSLNESYYNRTSSYQVPAPQPAAATPAPAPQITSPVVQPAPEQAISPGQVIVQNPANPFSTTVTSDGFYSFLKDSFKGDPAAKFDDSTRTVNITPQQATYIFNTYYNKR